MEQHKINKEKIYELPGRMRDLFGIPPKLISTLKYQIKYAYSNPRIKTIRPETLHKIIIDLFASDYYPVVSRNIRIDKFNYAVIMGGVAFNQNVPKKLPFLKLDTDDIDLKIYTTDINYLEKNEKTLYRVLSVFRFSAIIMCMYLKQILELIKRFTNDYTSGTLSHKQQYQQQLKQQPQQKPKYKYQTKKYSDKKKKQRGGASKLHSRVSNRNIANKGVLNDYQIFVLLKKKNENNVNETISKLDLINMSYSEIFNKIMYAIDDADLLLTNKIGYNMRYGNTIKEGKFRSITFSDLKVIYPNKENPAFYSYYFMNNKKEINNSIEKLINNKIPMEKIMETLSCSNNCKYISTETLLIDTTLMLSYADLLAYEKLTNGGKVLVPVGFVFKYYKYITKYIRLFVIKKYNQEGTLNDSFFNASRNLCTYVWNNLKQNTSQISETDDINIAYKKLLNEFHQNLFINKSLLTEYPELKEAIDEYTTIVYYINTSRALFKEIDNKSKYKGETIESITIQMADQELSKTVSRMHSGGDMRLKHNSEISIRLKDDIRYEDIELDNPEKGNKITKQIIISKIDKLMHDEITKLDMIKKTISRKNT